MENLDEGQRAFMAHAVAIPITDFDPEAPIVTGKANRARISEAYLQSSESHIRNRILNATLPEDPASLNQSDTTSTRSRHNNVPVNQANSHRRISRPRADDDLLPRLSKADYAESTPEIISAYRRLQMLEVYEKHLEKALPQSVSEAENMATASAPTDPATVAAEPMEGVTVPTPVTTEPAMRQIPTSIVDASRDPRRNRRVTEDPGPRAIAAPARPTEELRRNVSASDVATDRVRGSRQLDDETGEARRRRGL